MSYNIYEKDFFLSSQDSLHRNLNPEFCGVKVNKCFAKQV